MPRHNNPYSSLGMNTAAWHPLSDFDRDKQQRELAAEGFSGRILDRLLREAEARGEQKGAAEAKEEADGRLAQAWDEGFATGANEALHSERSWFRVNVLNGIERRLDRLRELEDKLQARLTKGQRDSLASHVNSLETDLRRGTDRLDAGEYE